MKQLLKRSIILSSFLVAFSAFGQNVGIGTNTPDPSAKLHILDANRGLLIPNVSLVNIVIPAPVTTPATGLLVWNTNGAVVGGSGVGFYYWNGTQWLRLSTGVATNDWELLGNTGTNEAVNFVGTTDAQDLVFRTNATENMRVNTNGNVGIGTTSDIARLFTSTPAADATTAYGIYNEHTGSAAGVVYGIRSNNYSATNSTKYGIYNIVNATGTGARYGFLNYTYLNSASNSPSYGVYNYSNTQGSASCYGIYNYVTTSTATGSQYGQQNYVYLNPASTANNYGELTYVDYSNGTRYGESKSLATNSTVTGIVYGDYNLINGSGNDVIYGLYADVSNVGSGAHYGVYSDVPGGANCYSGMFYEGNFVANEVGGDYDFRVESDTRVFGLWLDANENLVRFGTGSTASDYQNGTVIGAITVDYVVDFDAGGATGTAVGIGSIEYLLDGSSETTINNRFSPAVDDLYDLGSAALRWDDVYATNGTIVTSDEREKQDIVPMSYGLKEIMQLKPVTYKWKKSHVGSTTMTDDQKELKLGLIAQEVQQVLPEVVQTHDWKPVSEEDPTNYVLAPLERLGMSYHEIIPVLIKATQEQQAIIEDQNKKMEEMRTELDELKKLILNK